MINQLLDDYVAWLRDRYITSKINGYDKIVTPFHNHLGDRIILYSKIEGDEIRITDDGYTTNEFLLANLDYKTLTRKKIFDNTLLNYGVKYDDDTEEIYIEGRQANFSNLKYSIINAILQINDLFFTKKENLKSMFIEEVYNFFEDNDINGIQDINIAGASGVNHKIDFAISKTKTRPEMYFKIINNFDYQSATTEAYMYDDLKMTRKGTELIIIANDSEHNISSKALKVANSKQITILHWSNKNKILETVNT